jgi:hypothetical protein
VVGFLTQARARRWPVIGALVVALLASACGSDGGESGLAVHEFDPVSTDWLPAQILDLTVGQEHPSTPLEEDDEPYIDQLGVFSLRRGDLLQATLQVSRFADEDRLADGGLRRQLAAAVGSTSSPPVARVGDQPVYLVSGGRQTVAVWFHGPYMLVTSIREEYARPRALVRALTELEVGS